jgi:RNA recognition motif-containing protein
MLVNLKDVLCCLYLNKQLFLAIEGYVIFVGNLKEDVQEDQVKDHFLEFGVVKNINMNIDRKSGFMKVF